MPEGAPKNTTQEGLTAVQAEMRRKDIKELRILSRTGETDATIQAAQEELRRRAQIGAQKRARRREDEATRAERIKKQTLHKYYLSEKDRLERENGVDENGEVLTPKQIEEAAEEMAEVLLKMKERQKELEEEKRRATTSTT